MFSSCFVRGAEGFIDLLFGVEAPCASALLVEAPSSRRGERGDNTGILECTARCWVLGKYTCSACFSRFRTQRSELRGRLDEECLEGAVTLLFGLVPSRELTAEIPESSLRGERGERGDDIAVLEALPGAVSSSAAATFSVFVSCLCDVTPVATSCDDRRKFGKLDWWYLSSRLP